MNRKIILVIGLLILIGAGALLVFKKPSSPLTGNNLGNLSAEGTLKSLLTGGKSVKCTFTNQVEGASSEGTVYVADEKMRGDFKSTTPEGTSNSHMIVDSQFSYIWTDESNQGFKFAVETEASPSSQESSDESSGVNNQPIDLNEKGNYSCEDWRADNSLFSLPTNVTFGTFAIPSVPANEPSDTCAACANFPAGEAQDACKSQLGCE